MERPRRDETRPTPLADLRAREMRPKATTPERVLWSRLRAGRLGGLRFRRQHAIGGFIADFYCHDAALVVEVDSMWHYNAEGERRDAKRDAWMKEKGIRTIRVSASRLARDESGALDWIYRVAMERVAELGGVVNPAGRRNTLTHAPPPILEDSDHLPRWIGGGGERV